MTLLRILFPSILVLFGCSAAVQEQQDGEGYITISGKVGYPKAGALITLEKLEENKATPIDTFDWNVKNYTYEGKVKIEQPGYYRLNFFDLQYVPLILHKDDLEVNVDGNKQQGFQEVLGSRDHDFIYEVQKMNADFQQSEAIRTLNQAFGAAAQSKDEKVMDSLRAKYFEMEAGFKDDIIAKIDSLGASLGVVEILRMGQVFDKDKYFDLYSDYAALVKTELPGSKVAMDFVTEVEQMKKLAIGQVAPEIELPNPEGEMVKLSSLRGNYVLVDFWAKWCRPCRMENPNVVRMYKKFNEKGFEVFGVSLDRSRADWLQAIEEDQLHWTQVSDLKYWNSEAARLYNIKAIPFALLLDPNGVIIGKNLRGAELENKLQEIFSKS